MPDTPGRPLLNPVLRFMKEPRPEPIIGGGKNARGIKADRLADQRRTLAAQFQGLAAHQSETPRFADRAVMYASMFDDSLAPTWTPSDLFHRDRGARLLAPFQTGYVFEISSPVTTAAANNFVICDWYNRRRYQSEIAPQPSSDVAGFQHPAWNC